VAAVSRHHAAATKRVRRQRRRTQFSWKTVSREAGLLGAYVCIRVRCRSSVSHGLGCMYRSAVPRYMFLRNRARDPESHVAMCAPLAGREGIEGPACALPLSPPRCR
jgi:hypothetical protein